MKRLVIICIAIVCVAIAGFKFYIDSIDYSAIPLKVSELKIEESTGTINQFEHDCKNHMPTITN